MGSAFAEVKGRESAPSKLQSHIGGGDEGRDIIEGDLPVGDIDALVNLTDLEGEGNLQELGQEAIEQSEGGANLMLPEEG
jgi:hypothetical protein